MIPDTQGPVLRVAYVGNFDPPHSTENHVRLALEANGHQVTGYQENHPDAFSDLATALERRHHDLVLWTRTGWDWATIRPEGGEVAAHQDQLLMLEVANSVGVPTVGYHLDRWWGLNREHQVYEEPFFQCALVVTADGGHDEQWAAAGVTHHWLPPAVSRAEALREGHKRPELAAQVGFVGSVRSYHGEWLQHRRRLVSELQRHHRRTFRLWEGGVRGQDLCDLYASVDVLVGDSCLAGGATHYWSDRIPETLGRGGFLIHPEVAGLSDHFTPGEHLVTVPLADYDALLREVRWAINHADERRKIAQQGREHVLVHHTYERRMEQLVDVLRAGGQL